MIRLWGLFIDGERQLPSEAWPISKIPPKIHSIMTDFALWGAKVDLRPVAHAWKPSVVRMMREGRF